MGIIDLQVLFRLDTAAVTKMMMKTILLKRWMRMKMIIVMKSMSFAKDMAPAAVTLTQIQMEIMIQMRNQKLFRKKEPEGEEIPEPATEELQNQSQNHTHLLLKEELQELH